MTGNRFVAIALIFGLGMSSIPTIVWVHEFKSVPLSEGWVTPRAEWLPMQSLVPKGEVTPPRAQWLPTERLDTAHCKLIYVLRSVLDRGRVSRETCTCQLHIKCHQRLDYKMREFTIRHYAVGEVRASLMRDIPKAKNQCATRGEEPCKYVQEARRRRRESLSHAMLALQVW